MDRVPRNRGTVTSVIGALTLSGLGALMTIEGGTTGAVFTTYVKEFLGPTLREGQVVVLDNVGAHRVKAAKEVVEARGARLLFQPPYHPDLNPIEEAWAKLKGFVRGLDPRTVEDIDQAVVTGSKEITPGNSAGWFRHAGYQVA